MFVREKTSVEQERPFEHDGNLEAMTMPASVETVSQPKPRLFFIDNLRVALTMLVIVHHMAITYSAVAPWYYIEPPQDQTAQLLMGLLVLINQAFFMGLFFLISGYFTPGSYERKGGRAFIWDRVIRLGVPLLVFIFILGPLSMLPAFEYINSIAAPGETMTYAEFYLFSLGVGPLWFLEALLIFGALYALWRSLSRNQGIANKSDSKAPSAIAIILFTLGLALVTFVWRIWVPIGVSIPVLAFPTPGHLPQYISLFIIGILAYRRNWLMTISDTAGRIGFAVAPLVTLPMLAFAVTDLEGFLTNFVGGVGLQPFVYALWEAIFCVAMSIGLLTFFRKYLNRQGALGKFLSTHAYTVYIIHAPVIVGLAYMLQGVQLNTLLKFAIATVIAIPLCWMVAYLVRKLPLAERVL